MFGGEHGFVLFGIKFSFTHLCSSGKKEEKKKNLLSKFYCKVHATNMR